ncbi:hypothetical protein BDA99DRAFT_532068 [Phascolomyces articulosus]|uniref:Uncharacterized protein n=1 Tax=Phascolomyces articulosus TaxID=60185 RepID=A0AAD5KW16_9FUNG|nr:hypothetical protein BDA99DRAFT_532068 [Phascolomyces articulosus]
MAEPTKRSIVTQPRSLWWGWKWRYYNVFFSLGNPTYLIEIFSLYTYEISLKKIILDIHYRPDNHPLKYFLYKVIVDYVKVVGVPKESYYIRLTMIPRSILKFDR